MHAYISITDAAECTQRRGQGVKGSRCGSGWVRASSGRTGLRVDATRGAQDWVGCHGRDNKAQRLMLVQDVELILVINFTMGSAQLWLSKQCHELQHSHSEGSELALPIRHWTRFVSPFLTHLTHNITRRGQKRCLGLIPGTVSI